MWSKWVYLLPWPGINCESRLEEILRGSLPGNPEHWVFYAALGLWPLPLQNMPYSHEEIFYVSPPEVRNVFQTQTLSLNSSQWIYDAQDCTRFSK